MSIFYVYEHWRPDKDVCFYVGKGKGRRAYEFRRSYNKYYEGIANKINRLGLIIDVRIIASSLTEEEAFKLEVERIAFWRASGIKLTNGTNGGEGTSGHYRSPEAVERSVASRRGIPRSDDVKKKISAKNKGRVFGPPSEETKEKKRQKMIGYKFGPPSDETRRKMSNARKDRKTGPRLPEVVERMSAARLGVPLGPCRMLTRRQ